MFVSPQGFAVLGEPFLAAPLAPARLESLTQGTLKGVVGGLLHQQLVVFLCRTLNEGKRRRLEPESCSHHRPKKSDGPY